MAINWRAINCFPTYRQYIRRRYFIIVVKFTLLTITKLEYFQIEILGNHF